MMKNGVTWNRRALKAVADRFGLDLIVLFGSQAKGRARPDSDTDVAVLLNAAARRRLGKRSPVWELHLAGVLADAVRAPEGVDLVRLDRASPLLQFCAARDGVLLYERRRGEYVRFRLYAARQFDDNRKFFDLLDRHVRRRLA